MVGGRVVACVGVGARSDGQARRRFVEKVFSGMDTDRDGLVSREEFVEYCSRNNR